MLEEKIMTKKRFSTAVEELVSQRKDMDYLDAMVYIVNQRGLDMRNVPKLLTDSLKEKLEAQVTQKNLIKQKKKNSLPV